MQNIVKRVRKTPLDERFLECMGADHIQTKYVQGQSCTEPNSTDHHESPSTSHYCPRGYQNRLHVHLIDLKLIPLGLVLSRVLVVGRHPQVVVVEVDEIGHVAGDISRKDCGWVLLENCCDKQRRLNRINSVQDETPDNRSKANGREIL